MQEDNLSGSGNYKEVATILLLCISIIYFLSLYSHSFAENPFSAAEELSESQNYLGIFGAYIADFSYSLIGHSAFIISAIIVIIALRYYLGIFTTLNSWRVLLKFIGILILIVNSAGILGLIHPHYGGILGEELNNLLQPFFATGLWIIYITLEFVIIGLLTESSWIRIVQIICINIARFCSGIFRACSLLIKGFRRIITKISSLFASKQMKEEYDYEPPEKVITKPIKIHTPKNIVTNNTIKPKVVSTISSDSSHALPSSELLDPIQENIQYSSNELQVMADNLERELENFGITASVVDIIPGPVITSFEVDLPSGLKAAKVVSLDKDLARALLVQSVRIVDVIPGKHTIGIEIPNAHRQLINLREIIESSSYINSTAALTMCLGKNTSGKEVVIDLAKTPHLLVAGATGMGKSIGLNAMLMGILFKSTPKDVRLIMIDPKVVELAIYENIPHLLTPVVTNMNEASSALYWCISEMERRYSLLAKHGVRNVVGFNEKVMTAKSNGTPLVDEENLDEAGNPSELEQLPLIVIVIDEYADMLGLLSGEDRAKAKRTEGFIIRIAQKARAAGMHLIIATQRPSVDVITGLIKSNIPSRVAFKVSSKIDSRTILDNSGAEGLLGMGDMLYIMPGNEFVTRVHGAFVSDIEISKVVSFLKESYPTEYLHDVTKLEDESSTSYASQVESSGENDPLYDEAVEFVLSSGKASISSVQRRLRIGYNRAARIIDDMEAAGLVSPMNANGNREILAPKN